MLKLKNIKITTLIVFLALTLFVTIPTLPLARADYDRYDNSCDHWDHDWVNTYNDTFTATDLRAHFYGHQPGAFDHAHFQFIAGTGGNYSPLANYPMYCTWQYAQGINWYSGSYNKAYDFSTSWTYDGVFYYDANVYDYTLYFDWFNPVRGLTQNWFQRPDNPTQYWLCGADWASVSAS